MLRAVLSALVLLLASTPGEGADPPGAVPYELQLIPAGSASPRPATAWERDGILYLAANDVSVLLNAGKFWRSELGRLTFVTGQHEIQVMEGTDLALIDGARIFHLPGSVFLWEGRVMVPLDLFVDEAGNSRDWVELPVSFSREDRKLEAARGQVSVSGATIERERTGWRLVIETDTPIRYELVGSRRSAFVIRFPELAYDPLLFPLPGEHRWFQDLRLRNLAEGLEISFTPGPRAVGFRISHSPQTRVEVFLGLDERDLREGKLRGFSTVSYLVPTQLMLVALDPGHGGDDKGARVSGGFEHALAWELAMMVADRLTRELGIDVVFTREENESSDPLGRAETANRVDADFMISLHLHDRPGGPMGFVADVGTSGRSPTSTLITMGFRSFGAGQSSYVPTSRMIARQVLDAVAGRLRQGEQGVVAEPLPQLAAATMPAMLLELGSGGSRKWTRERLEAVADGIVEGLRLYQMTGEDEQ